MTILDRNVQGVNLDVLDATIPADLWPSSDEVDGWFWEPTSPDALDAEWAAAELSDGTYDSSDYAPDDWRDMDDSAIDEAAIVAAAQDSLDRGLIPADLAELLAGFTLVGHSTDLDLTADDVLHAGSDARFCGCEPCVWARTARYADA